MALRRNNSILNCEICHQHRSEARTDRFVATQCGHVFHETHLRRWINESLGSRCPVDKKLVDLEKLVPLYGYDPSNRNLKVKIAVLGDTGVGKTCLVKRFCTGVVDMKVVSTVPMDLYTRNLVVDFERVNLEIWEPSGQERYHQIIPQFLRGCHGIIFCYDSMHFQSLVNVNQIWKKYATRYVNQVDDYVSILLECKTDLSECKCTEKNRFCRPVTRAEKETTLALLGIETFSTSALSSTDDGLEAPFQHVVRQIMESGPLMEQILAESQDNSRVQLAEDDDDEMGCWERFKMNFKC